MNAITLNPEQIAAAPPEVRHWLENEVLLPHGRDYSPLHAAPTHLVTCSGEEAGRIYALLHGKLPVLNVFFELGRKGMVTGMDGVEALRLVDIVRQARLGSMDQLAACLDLINAADRQIRGDMSATLYMMDARGNCLVTTGTCRSISHVWRKIISSFFLEDARAPNGSEGADTGNSPAPFTTMQGMVSPAAVHRGDYDLSGTAV